MAEKKEITISQKEILNWLSGLNFVKERGRENIFFKEYKSHIIIVDVTKGQISYPEDLIVHDRATSNLYKRENLVVLECVDRLLLKGYQPSKIELEKNWKLGHKGKGRLDILVKNGGGSPFLMIECKTWGKEYTAEKQKMYADGGQLISYYVQARTTQYLVLYSSTIIDGSIRYVNDIINITDDLAKCTDSESLHERWDKNFKTKGLFDDDIRPYKIEFKGLFYKDLIDMGDDSSGLIFNQFAEILRRNAVSDKSNAFNKIFNLFICKIVDEDSKYDTSDEMDFQFKGDDTYELFFDRLNSLYKQGALNYINIDIEDLSNRELDKLLNSLSNKDKIKKAFIKLRLYKNNEFAFKEVYNENTFLENALIVKEVVQLLQPYRLKYNQKQQFLGDFFERLLNSGFKQEVGQYFTPIPLSGFVCKSLPIHSIINNKNDLKNKYFLPYVIDFASGSGHFLTEIMDEINQYVQQIARIRGFIKGGRNAKDEFDSFSSNYKWAKEFIYGIEKDYRLAKTTKIHTFLNGDGDANIIMGDGLDNFKRSKTYIKKLKDIDVNGDGVFDIVVANPPYSISEFKNTLLSGAETFTLYKYITEKSGNIECLFLERTKQLLSEGGVAGIILPVSFLTSSETISEQTRNLLFKSFKIKACVYLGEKTFMATNAFTIVLFLEKRKSSEIDGIQKVIEKYFDDFIDYSFIGIDNVVEKYVQYVYKTMTIADYKYFIRNYPIIRGNANASKNELCHEYVNESLSADSLIALEKRKLFHFMISYNQKIVIADSGSGNRELDFLGYEFSGRRGSEGIKLKKAHDGSFKTKLFNPNNLNDDSKVNYYILKSFENDLPLQINPALKDYLEIVDLCELFEFNNYTFDNAVRYGIQHTKFVGKTVKLKTFFDPVKGVTYKKQDQQRVQTGKRVLTSTHINLENGTYKLEKPIFLSESFDMPEESKLCKNDLFVSTSNSLKHLGKVALIDKNLDYWGGGFCTILRPKSTLHNAEEISRSTKEILQNSKEFRAFINLYKNSRISNIGSDLLNFRIPLPTMNVTAKTRSKSGYVS